MLETVSFISSLWTQNLYAAEGALYPGANCPPPLHPSCMLSFYVHVLIKGLRRAWLFEVSESPSRGYWKQFLLSHPYEHSQNLHAAETLPRGKLFSPPPPPRHPPPLKCHVCFHFDVMIKGLRRAWLFEVLKSLQEDAGNSFFYLIPMNTEFICSRRGTLPRGKLFPPPSSLMYAFFFMFMFW